MNFHRNFQVLSILCLVVLLVIGGQPATVLDMGREGPGLVSAETVDTFKGDYEAISLELLPPSYKRTAAFIVPSDGFLVGGGLEVEGVAWSTEGQVGHNTSDEFMTAEALEHLEVDNGSVRLEHVTKTMSLDQANDWAGGTGHGLEMDDGLMLEGRNDWAFLWDTVLSNASNEQENVILEVDSKGVTHAVWEDNRKGLDIYYANSDDGLHYSNERDLTMINDTFILQQRPDMAVGADDTIHIVFADERTTKYDLDIFYKRSIDHGKTFQSDIRVDHGGTYLQNEPEIAVDAQGSVHIVWEDNRDGNVSLYYSKDFGTEFRVSNSTAGHQLQPDIELDANGWVHVVWRDNRSSPDNWKIYHSRLAPSGTEFQDEGAIDLGPLGTTQYMPTLETDDDGNAFVAWHDDRGLDFNIYVTRTSDGTTFDQPARMSPVLYRGLSPNMDFRDGTLHLVWYDYSSGDPDVYYRNITEWGSSASSIVRVDHNNGTSKARSPAVAAGLDGLPRVAWVDLRQHAGGDLFATKGAPAFVENGTLEVAYDLEARPVSFEDANWTGTFPPGCDIEIYGRTSMNGLSWGPYVDLVDSPQNLTPGRYLQLRVELTTENQAYSPTVEQVRFTYTHYSESGVMISSMFKTSHPVTNATVDWELSGDPTTVKVSISTDGGLSWAVVEAGVPLDMGTPGTELAYKVEMERYVEGSPFFESIVLSYIERSYPSDLEIKLDGTKVWGYNGPFSRTAKITDLEDLINGYLADHGSDDEGTEVPIEVVGRSPGTIMLFDLELDFARPPQITDSGPGSKVDVDEGVETSFWVSANDVDGRALEYEWSVDGEVVEGEGNTTFFYTPDFTGEARTDEVVVKVSNGYLTSERGWKVNVDPVNRGPVIESYLPEMKAVLIEKKDQVTTFSVIASDPDGDTLYYTWTINGDVVDAVDGNELVLDPADHIKGDYLIEVEVSDRASSAKNEWSVTILPFEGNGDDGGNGMGVMLLAILILLIMIVAGIVFVETYRKGLGNRRLLRRRLLDEEERLLKAGDELRKVKKEEALQRKGKAGPRPKRKKVLAEGPKVRDGRRKAGKKGRSKTS